MVRLQQSVFCRRNRTLRHFNVDNSTRQLNQGNLSEHDKSTHHFWKYSRLSLNTKTLHLHISCAFTYFVYCSNLIRISHFHFIKHFNFVLHKMTSFYQVRTGDYLYVCTSPQDLLSIAVKLCLKQLFTVSNIDIYGNLVHRDLSENNQKHKI